MSMGKPISIPWKLRRISRRLAREPKPPTLDTFLDQGREEEEAISTLLDYCEKDSHIRAVMKRHDVNREDLREIYLHLIHNLGALWTGGHWLPASSLGLPVPLEYILKHPDVRGFGLIAQLTRYFERDPASPVT